MKLKDSECKNAKGKDKPYKLGDGKGLYLEVTTKGAKYWRLKYRIDNKEKRLFATCLRRPLKRQGMNISNPRLF